MSDVIEKLPEQVSVTSTPVGVGGMSILDVTGLVGMFGGMLGAMEGRILDRMRENSEAARDRWALHDAELARNREAIVARFGKVEGRIEEVNTAVTAHHLAAHDERLVRDARVRPVMRLFGNLVKNWRSVALLILFLTTAFIELVVGFAERAHP